MLVIKHDGKSEAVVRFEGPDEIGAIEDILRLAGADAYGIELQHHIVGNFAEIHLDRPSTAVVLIAVVRKGLAAHPTGTLDYKGTIVSAHEWFGWLIDDLKACLSATADVNMLP